MWILLTTDRRLGGDAFCYAFLLQQTVPNRGFFDFSVKIAQCADKPL